MVTDPTTGKVTAGPIKLGVSDGVLNVLSLLLDTVLGDETGVVNDFEDDVDQDDDEDDNEEDADVVGSASAVAQATQSSTDGFARVKAAAHACKRLFVAGMEAGIAGMDKSTDIKVQQRATGGNSIRG